MAFNNFLTPAWVNAGSDIYWWYTFNDNRGAQYAMANCKTPDGQMLTTGEADELTDGGYTVYYVNFHNNGPRPCYHNLNGGGLT
jgi:hypothetical protein